VAPEGLESNQRLVSSVRLVATGLSSELASAAVFAQNTILQATCGKCTPLLWTTDEAVLC
jgi:hypothetical protein